MKNKLNRSQTWSGEQSILTRSFTLAGLGFLSICVIGLIAFFVMDSTQVGQEIRNSSISNIYSPVGGIGGSGLITKLSYVSMGLVVVTGIMQFIWFFRINTASKLFIYSIWIGYIIGQGLGFGFLFLTFQAAELFLIFGLAGGLFLTMALVGYFSKNLSGMGRYLFAGSIFSMAFGIILTILSATGVFNLGDKYGLGNVLFDLMFFFSGIILLGYISYTVWRIKQLDEYNNAYGLDQEMEFRYITFFAFRLMSDMVALVWYLARFVGRAMR